MPHLTVVKTKKQTEYCVVDMRPFRNDSSISWKAKGILLYLIDRPEDWIVSYNHLATLSDDGIDSVKSAVKELKDAGYIDIKSARDEHGAITGWQWTVYENTSLRGSMEHNAPEAGLPHVVNPECGNPDTGKSPTTKYRYNNYGTNKKQKQYTPEFENVWGRWEKKRRGTKRAGFRKWCSLLKEGLPVEYLTNCALNYINDCLNEDRFMKNVSTFFGPDRHFEEYEQEVKHETEKERTLRRMRELTEGGR